MNCLFLDLPVFFATITNPIKSVKLENYTIAETMLTNINDSTGYTHIFSH